MAIQHFLSLPKESHGNAELGWKSWLSNTSYSSLLAAASRQATRSRSHLQRRLIYHQDQLKENPKDATQTWYVGAIYSLLGDTDNAILYMKKILKLDIMDYWWFETYAEYRNVHNDPRYKALMADARQQVAKMRAEVLAMEAKEQKKVFFGLITQASYDSESEDE